MDPKEAEFLKELEAVRWKGHDTEHELIHEARLKAEQAMDHRLEGMNEFRQQLQNQAGTFVTREWFERFQKESDSVLKAIVSRNDTATDALRAELQEEREYRNKFEGSVNTWKGIVGFLGLSGIGGVIILLVRGFLGG